MTKLKATMKKNNIGRREARVMLHLFKVLCKANKKALRRTRNDR